MTKRETLKWTLQIIASVITAVRTALGANSCMGMKANEASDDIFRCLFLFLLCVKQALGLLSV